jgi:hypothetical protein
LAAQPNESIQSAVEIQLKHYPKSTLQDIYKSFFQDEFGPGHMAPDSAGAAGYLEYELAGMSSRKDYTAEPCGTGEHFYRVPLDLVKDGIIPKDVFMVAFLNSARDFKEPHIGPWKQKWAEIFAEIEMMDLDLPGFEADKKMLEEMLDSGEYVVHHSRAYTEAYDPHYRIMSKAAWDKLNLKLRIQNSEF